jgi:hypothetical protein
MSTPQTTMEILQYTQALCESLEVDYRLYCTRSHRHCVERNQDAHYHNKCLQEIADGTYTFTTTFEIVEGRKYYKVVMLTSGNRSVHCFVNKTTGDVLKSASWNAPAKGVRYNLLNKESRENCYRYADWSGRYLYLR